MPGVEIHANTLQTILDQQFLRNMSWREKMVLLFLICFASTAIFIVSKLRWSVVYGITLMGGYTAAIPLAFQKGLILDLIHPYLAVIGTFMGVYLYRYLTEFREKSELKNAFGKYVDPGVIARILEHPELLKLGGEKRPVTVLFTDIEHFTSIAENLSPESLVALLNEYFEAMSEVILEQGGTLDKFEGDAIMAFFGAPLPQPDHALRACKAALSMRRKLNFLQQKWKSDPLLPGGEKKPELNFRCGISTGEVIVGNVGSSKRFDYTVMGDIVNLGSRLEGANKKYGTRTIVSEATANEVKDFFEMRELDILRVVGKSKPVRIYEILNFKGELVPEAQRLLELYVEGIKLYHERKFEEALGKFQNLLSQYPSDEPSKLYLQRCEVLKNYPPKPEWNGVFDMGVK